MQAFFIRRSRLRNGLCSRSGNGEDLGRREIGLDLGGKGECADGVQEWRRGADPAAGGRKRSRRASDEQRYQCYLRHHLARHYEVLHRAFQQAWPRDGGAEAEPEDRGQHEAGQHLPERDAEMPPGPLAHQLHQRDGDGRRSSHDPDVPGHHDIETIDGPAS